MEKLAVVIEKEFKHFFIGKKSKRKIYKPGTVLDFGNSRVYEMRKDGALINLNKKKKEK